MRCSWTYLIEHEIVLTGKYPAPHKCAEPAKLPLRCCDQHRWFECHSRLTGRRDLHDETIAGSGCAGDRPDKRIPCRHRGKVGENPPDLKRWCVDYNLRFDCCHQRRLPVSMAAPNEVAVAASMQVVRRTMSVLDCLAPVAPSSLNFALPIWNVRP